MRRWRSGAPRSQSASSASVRSVPPARWRGLPETRLPDDSEWKGARYFAQGHCEELDALIEKVAASRDRDMDGRYDLEMATEEIADRLNQFGDELSEYLQRRRIQDCLHDFRNSAFAPILDAMHMHTSWRGGRVARAGRRR